jgi:hypothetical protein
MPRLMTRSRLKGALCAGLAASAFLALAPAAHADTLDLTLSGKGLENQVASIAGTVNVTGKLSNPGGPGVPVTVTATVGKDTVVKRQILTQTQGNFTVPIFVNRCCQYRISATANPPSGPVTKTAAFNVGGIPKLHNGSTGPKTKLFLTLLREQGYFVRGKDKFTSSTQLAILAFRKVNKLNRNTSYSKSIFRTLLEGKGAFPLAHPEEGKHVEADLSRQVLVLAEGGKPKYTFPISSGTSATPTVTGKFHFYLKTPGYNAKSMYYSAYFIGGYATHGYNPVPNYPASHGCLRNPIADSVFIYNWINIGDTIYVYH